MRFHIRLASLFRSLFLSLSLALSLSHALSLAHALPLTPNVALALFLSTRRDKTLNTCYFFIFLRAPLVLSLMFASPTSLSGVTTPAFLLSTIASKIHLSLLQASRS